MGSISAIIPKGEGLRYFYTDWVANDQEKVVLQGQGNVREFYFESGKIDILKLRSWKIEDI